MLPREHRLVSSEGFRQATRHGRRAAASSLVVHLWDPGTDEGPASVGFVVSKAVGNAVQRNRVKRRLRHLVREHVTSLPGSAVLVIRCLPGAAEASYAELRRDLDRALSRVGAA